MAKDHQPPSFTPDPSALTHDENVRIKCLDRAINSIEPDKRGAQDMGTKQIVERARAFEQFVKEVRDDVPF